MAFKIRSPISMVATSILFSALAAADTSLTTITASAPAVADTGVITITASAVASSVTTGSYTLCQFYSSIPGATSEASATTLTLPACPSSILTFSYTDVLPSTTVVPSTLQPTAASSYTLCQFYSSIPGATPGPTSGATTLTLPPCPSNGETFSYTVAPTTTGATSVTPVGASTSSSGTGLVPTFTGMAVPTAAVDKIAIAGIGAFVAVAGML